MGVINPVTVVVPVYGNPEISLRAVTSVITHVDLTHNRLIVINDGGPEKIQVREAIEPILRNIFSARYVENEENLGFVLSSNRAVFELDQTSNDILILNSDAALTDGAFTEMAEVLNASERHAVVIPRTSHGAIASFPQNPRCHYSEQESHLLFQSHNQKMPRISIVPTAPGFCILFRRSVIENYGLFDSVFSPGYDEENDFLLRINESGYSTVLANHAFVFHEGSQSFGVKRKALQTKHEKVLLRRYPHYPDLLFQYFQNEIDPVDQFADYLDVAENPKVLIDCSSLGAEVNGTSTNIVSFLNKVSERLNNQTLNWDVTIRISADATEIPQLQNQNFAITNPNLEENEFYDLGIALSPIWDMEAFCFLSSRCSRIVISHLDIIALRIGRLRVSSISRKIATLSALEWSDKAVFISEAAKRDVEMYSPNTRIRSAVVIPQGNPAMTQRRILDNTNLIEGEGFDTTRNHKIKVLVVGNSFPHKQVKLAIRELAFSGFEVIALGSRNLRSGGVKEFRSGKLSDQTISNLYKQADVVVIPSAYEGYGLPIPQAISSGKPTLIFDTETSREVVSGLSATKSVTFFQKFSKLENLIHKVVQEPSINQDVHLRTISDYNHEFIDIVKEVLRTPVDSEHLRKRVAFHRLFATGNPRQTAAMKWQQAQLSRRSVRWSTKFADKLWGPIYQRWIISDKEK